MPYKVLADSTALLHFLWIVFLIGGAYWGRRHNFIKAVHLGGLGFAVLMQLMEWYCPLTHLEYWLRQGHEPGLTYTGSFLVHYVEHAVYLELSAGFILFLTLGLAGLNAWIYLGKTPEKLNTPTP